MGKRELTIPRNQVVEDVSQIPKVVTQQITEQGTQSTQQTGDTAPIEGNIQEQEKKMNTEEELIQREKVFFEDDEKIRLRDGKTYYIPPLGLRDARRLMHLLNTIDSGIIITNLVAEDEDDPETDRYEALIDVLLMGFKPYYSHVTREYLADYVDVVMAKQIIDIMIGLNGLKKLL